MKEPNQLSAEKMTRRGFLGGIAAAFAAPAAAESPGAPEESLRPQARPEREPLEVLKDRVFETRQPMSEQVSELSGLLYKDIDIVMDRTTSLAEDFAEYDSLFSLVRNELPLTDIPEPLQSTVREMMMFVPYVESRFDPEAVSSQEAFGIMQLMPATWEEHAQEDEDMTSLIDQVHVAGRLLDQIYRYVSGRHEATINAITDMVYRGDTERCQREFVGPVIMAGYFCGMGTVANLLDGFAHDYIDPDDVERMQDTHILDEEYGLYTVCTKAGEVHEYDKNFGSEAAVYFSKVVSARLVVQAGIPAEMYEEMVHSKNA